MFGERKKKARKGGVEKAKIKNTFSGGGGSWGEQWEEKGGTRGWGGRKNVEGVGTKATSASKGKNEGSRGFTKDQSRAGKKNGLENEGRIGRKLAQEGPCKDIILQGGTILQSGKNREGAIVNRRGKRGSDDQNSKNKGERKKRRGVGRLPAINQRTRVRTGTRTNNRKTKAEFEAKGARKGIRVTGGN